MHKLTNWTVNRSGPRMVIRGTDQAGQATKLGVDEISVEPNDGHPVIVAVDRRSNPPLVIVLKA